MVYADQFKLTDNSDFEGGIMSTYIREGLLWYDETRKKPIIEVILDAADYYERKFNNVVPATVMIAESEIVTEDIGMTIINSKLIKPHHVLVGV